MSSDLEIVQDLFNAFGIHGTLQWPVNMLEFVSAAEGLRDMGKDRESDPRHIMQCIDRMYQSIGAPYFANLIDHPADVDDVWVSYWCPQPAGVELHRADCPAGTTPLWSNGTQTVFCRRSQDKHGNAVYGFAIHGG